MTVPVQWSSQVDFRPTYGLTAKDFNDSYKATYKVEPGYHAAGGYAAGLMLQRALERAGSLDTASVAKTLDSLNENTFYGRIQFSADPVNHGLQIGHKMIVLQWQKIDGQMAKVVVWPTNATTTRIVIGGK